MKRIIIIAFALCICLYCSEAYADTGPADKTILTLENCIQEAVNNNPEIRSAREEINRQSALVGQAKSALFPSLELFGTGSKTEANSASSDVLSADEQLLSGNIELSQTLFSAGANQANLNAEKMLAESAKHALTAKIDEIVLQTQKQFFDALLALAQITVQEQLVSLVSEQLESEKLKQKSGKVSDFNVLRAEVEFANSRITLIRAQNKYRLQLEDLGKTLGRDEDWFQTQAITLNGNWREESSSLSIDQAIQKAKASRPELKELQALIEAEKEKKTIAFSDYFPKISAFASYQLQSLDGPDINRENDAASIFGARLSWNIFDSFKTAYSVKEAKSKVRLATIDRERINLDIGVQVKRSYSALVEASELVKASSKTIEQAVESVRLARARLDAGVGTLLDVLDAQLALTQARTNKILAHHDYSIAMVEFEYATATKFS